MGIVLTVLTWKGAKKSGGEPPLSSGQACELERQFLFCWLCLRLWCGRLLLLGLRLVGVQLHVGVATPCVLGVEVYPTILLMLTHEGDGIINLDTYSPDYEVGCVLLSLEGESVCEDFFF